MIRMKISLLIILVFLSSAKSGTTGKISGVIIDKILLSGYPASTDVLACFLFAKILKNLYFFALFFQFGFFGGNLSGDWWGPTMEQL